MPPRSRKLPGSLQVESRAVADLAADPRNHRTHDERNIEAIAASLKRFGQQKPIVVDRADVVRAGNGTLEAASRIGWDSIDVVVTDLEGDEATAYGIADNRTAELAGWDVTALAETLPSFDPDLLNATGFDPDDVAQLLNSLEPPDPGDGDPDALPPTPAKPRSKPGDLWLLGPHRLVVGDATDLAVVRRLMDGERADCLWTDPPYGVDYVGGTGKQIDNDQARDIPELLRGAFAGAAEALRPGAPFYIAHPDGPKAQAFYEAVLEARWHWSQTLIWVKNSLVLGQSDYQGRHEPILYGYLPQPAGQGRRGRRSKRWFGDNSQTTVFEIPRPTRSEDHPTMKPVDLVVAHLSNSTAPRHLVYDPFAGSGTTLIACHTLGRAARLVELNTGYADVICRRYQDFADDLPVLARTGKAVDFRRR